MALPKVTSVTPNGGSPSGGTAIVIAGENFTGASSVVIGGIAATAVVAVSATEITATTGSAANSTGQGYASGTYDTIVTATGGVSAAVEGDVYIYYVAQTAKSENLRTSETVPVGSIKVAGTYPAGSPVSYKKFAGAETLKFPLLGAYSNFDYIEVEANLAEIEGAPKPKFFLEDSIDGGATWSKTEGLAESAEVVAGTPLLGKGNMAEKEFGPLLRLAVKSAAAGGMAGTFTVLTQRSSVLRK
jgi:hypothetical protein